MTWIQNFFDTNKRWLVVTMTILVGIAYLASFNGYPGLFNITMLAVAIIGGLPILIRAVSALRYKIISIELLVSIAVISTIMISEFSEAGIVIWLFAIGDVLETMTLAKTRNAIKALVQMAPQKAIKISDDASKTQLEVAIDDVTVGDQLLVKAGSQIPVDGHVVSGSGHVNEASITGESKPSHKQINSAVFAGTVLDSGTLFIEAEKVGEDTAFGKLIEIVEEAQDSQTATQRFIDRFSQYYTPLVLITAMIVGLISQDLKLAITILVLGCPGALVIGVPVSTVAGIGSAAKQGVIVKGSSVLDDLRKIDTFVFDKTGTLTTGHPNVGDVQNFVGQQPDNLKILASVEQYSDHPLAKAILTAYPATDRFNVTKSEIIGGRGIRAVINGDDVLVGNERLLHEHGIATAPVHLPETSSHVLLAVNGQLRLALEVKDPLRPHVGLGIMMSITNGKRVQIEQVRKEVSQVTKTQKYVTTQIDNLQTTYNANDAKAKSRLLEFAKAYYTFSNQSDYDKRFNKVSDILSLSNDQQDSLFDSGLDATGGSLIDNLGLTSQYQTATGYTSDLNNQTIECLATVVVKTSGTAQKAINQTVLLHGWFDIKTQKLTSIKINQIQ